MSLRTYKQVKRNERRSRRLARQTQNLAGLVGAPEVISAFAA